MVEYPAMKFYLGKNNLNYVGHTESHEQLFFEPGNSRRKRVRWQVEPAVVLTLSVLWRQ
jgi:hypothetical protein